MLISSKFKILILRPLLLEASLTPLIKSAYLLQGKQKQKILKLRLLTNFFINLSLS